MKNYVVGFMFNYNQTEVVLIEKQKPEWQKGKLNGLGGTIEPGENPYQAMIREFKEEADVETEITDWVKFGFMRDEQRGIYLYLMKSFDHSNKYVPFVKTAEKEEVITAPIHLLNVADKLITVPNLKVFIPMALTMDFLNADILMSLEG